MSAVEGSSKARSVEQRLQRQLALHSFGLNASRPSPIDKLPDDVLRYVFLIPSSEGWHHWGQFSVCVSHVCSRWRAVAREISRLWASLKFRLPYDPKYNAKDPMHEIPFIQLVEKNIAFLLRSKASNSLDLAIALDRRYTQETGAGWQPIILECLQRTGCLTFDVLDGKPITFTQIMSQLCEANPPLRNLKISSADEQGIDQLSDPYSSYFYAVGRPLLRDITLSGVPLPRRFEAFGACERLRLDVSYPFHFEEHHLVWLLFSCFELRSFHLEISTLYEHGDEIPESGYKERILMPKLTHYTIKQDGSSKYSANFFRTPFDNVKAPALQSLDIEVETYSDSMADWTEYPLSVTAFLHASNAPLSSLSIRQVPAPFVTQILGSVPKLTHLILSPSPDTSSYYSSVLRTMTPPRKCLCPQLESLACLEAQTDAEGLKPFLELARGRKLDATASVVPLRRMEMSEWRRDGVEPLRAAQWEAALADAVNELVIGERRFNC